MKQLNISALSLVVYMNMAEKRIIYADLKDFTILHVLMCSVLLWSCARSGALNFCIDFLFRNELQACPWQQLGVQGSKRRRIGPSWA
jgi:hypothetical protein